MTAPHWDQGGDPYRRYLDSGGATEDANRLRLAKQRQHGEDVTYFCGRALWALNEKERAEQKAATLTARLDQEQARVAELEAELGTLTDDTGPAYGVAGVIVGMCVVAWLVIVAGGWVLWNVALPAAVGAVTR